MTVRDPTARQVVGGYLNRDPVAFQDADTEAAKLPRDGGQYSGPVIERHPKRRAWQHFRYGSFELD